jgi:sodium-dependent dicarboxylate transporter 2/3/5
MKEKGAKDTIFLVLSLALIIGSRFMPPVGGLSSEAWGVLGVFFGSLLMWITISIDWPSMITLLALGFLPTFGFGKTFNGAFGNSTVAFLLFTFALVYPLSKTNFVRRCTVGFITNKIARKGPWYFVCFLFAAVTFMGLFISPSVLFVAFMPFLEDIFCGTVIGLAVPLLLYVAIQPLMLTRFWNWNLLRLVARPSGHQDKAASTAGNG